MLRRLSMLAWRLLYLSAWLVVLFAGTLLFLEESGLLTRIVRDRIAAELGALGPSLEIGSTELRWFEPGMRLHDVTILAPSDDAPGDDPERGADVLLLDEIHLSFEPGFDLTQPLRRVHVLGGHVRLSDDLSRALELAGGPQGDEEEEQDSASPWERLLSPPPIVFSDVAVSLALPDRRDFELGHASLVADPLNGGGYQLNGRLEPSLGGAVDAGVTGVQIEGRLQPSGAHVRASARNLRFASDEMSAGSAADSLPFARCAGQLALNATLALTDWGTAVPRLSGSLRTSLTEGALALVDDAPAIESVRAELDASFDLAAGERLWRREAWEAKAVASAEYRATPVEARARFGQDVPGEDWVHAWARIPELPLDAALLDELSAPAEARDLFVALEPVGTVDVSLDLRLPDPPAFTRGSRTSPLLAAHVAIPASAGATYRGLYDVRSDTRYGFPLPLEAVQGHILLGHDASDLQADHLRLDLEGDPGAGSVRFDGAIFTPVAVTPEFRGPDFDLRIDVRDLPLDERAELALSDHPGTSDLWRIWSPTAGKVDTWWRLYSSIEVGGMSAEGQVFLEDADVRWEDLPVPVRDVDGELRFHWASDAVSRTDDPRGLRKHRPMGIRYRFSNDDGSDRVGLGVEAVGMARQRSVGDTDVGAEVLTRPWIQAVEVRLPEVFLRGSDWDVLVARTPELAETAQSLGVKGSARAVYRGVAHLGAEHFVSDVEAEPMQVEVTPQFFRRRTRDLGGRLLVRTRAALVDIGQEPPPATSEAAFHLSGRWAQGVELAAVGRIPAAGEAAVEVFGAGIDPTNNAFRGALLRSLTEGGDSRLDEEELSSQTLSGRLDLGVATSFEVGGEDKPRNAYRVFLRGNRLETKSLSLDGLRGVLEQREDVLRSELMRAELGGHPVELRDVLVQRLADAAEDPDADPLFAQPGVWEDPDGVGIQARLSTEDLPLDVEHLSDILSREALRPLEESGTWSGLLDVRDARILVTSEQDGNGIVAVKGQFRPHDLTTRLGVPIRVRAADLTLGELILEGGRVRGWGEITNLDAELAGRRLEDARMVVGYVDGRLTIDDLAGAFEGGELVALGSGVAGARKALGIDLSAPYRFDLAMSLEDVELDRLLRGVFPSSIADQGRVDLQLSLSGTPGDVRGLTGGGWVRLDEGRLWSIPVARALFYQVGIPDTAVFDRMRARFQLREGRIEGSYLEMKSSLINLVGSGWLDLDGRLSMDLEVRYSILDRLGSLSRILYWLNDNLWRVAARGDLTRPRVSIRNVLLELFGGFEDNPRRELPVPGISDLGPRF